MNISPSPSETRQRCYRLLRVSLRAAAVAALLLLSDASVGASQTLHSESGLSPLYPLRSSSQQTTRDAASANDVDTSATVGVQGGRYGIGFGAAWPSYGISGTMQISPTFTGEAIIGLFGNLTTLGAKGWYRFNRNTTYDVYGYGAVSMYHYSSRYRVSGVRYSYKETIPGLGVGAGIDLSLPKLIKDDSFPPLFLNFELGLSVSLGGFDYYDGFNAFTWGTGIHYRFGGKK